MIEGNEEDRRKLCFLLSRVLLITDGVLDWWIGFIDTGQVITTNNYYTIVDFHTTDHSTLSLLSLFPLVFKW
jgi:hypothetical protein